jgi:hypothetical protein
LGNGGPAKAAGKCHSVLGRAAGAHALAAGKRDVNAIKEGAAMTQAAVIADDGKTITEKPIFVMPDGAAYITAPAVYMNNGRKKTYTTIRPLTAEKLPDGTTVYKAGSAVTQRKTLHKLTPLGDSWETVEEDVPVDIYEINRGDYKYGG